MSVAYKCEEWDNYAESFLSVMPSVMLILNKSVAAMAKGNVCDFGCGAAKIAPFVLDNTAVTSYTGVDYSVEMVNLARWHLRQFPEKPSEVFHSKIESLDPDDYDLEVIPGQLEHVEGCLYDFGLSINSYYAWDEPVKSFKSIYKLLKPQADFVLVSPNPELNMASLLRDAKRELVFHPHFATFCEKNMALVGNEKALFVEMDVMVEQVREAGFKVLETHQKFYDGGLNYLHLNKS